MQIETVEVLLRFQGMITIRVEAEKFEFVLAPQATIAPEIIPQRHVEIIYQCGASEFVLVET